MSSYPRVKICGINSTLALEGALEAGADYVGFVFYPPSPRHVDRDLALALALDVPVGLVKVGLFVDPDNALLDDILGSVPLDMIQLHGSETPERVSQIRSRMGLPLMKAIKISTASDLERLADYPMVDQFLLDAQAGLGPQDLPGGNGVAFDWGLLADFRSKTPWMLAGGLTPENVATALARTSARQLDVSSGVESQKGVKDPEKMRRFVKNARAMIEAE